MLLSTALRWGGGGGYRVFDSLARNMYGNNIIGNTVHA